MVKRIIYLAVFTVLVIFVVDQFKPSLFHWPKPHGKTTVTTNTDALTNYFQSRQGMTAGESDYSGIDVQLDHQTVSFLPTWVAGSCLTLNNGQGSVTYYSDWKPQAPTIQQTSTGELVTLPEPTPLSVAITKFDQSSIKTNWHCGFVAEQLRKAVPWASDPVPDVQGANAQLMKTLCGLAQTDQAHLDQRKSDVVTALKEINPNVEVAWMPSTKAIPKGC